MNHETAGWATKAAEPKAELPPRGRTWVRATPALTPRSIVLAPVVRLVGANWPLYSTRDVPRRATPTVKPKLSLPAGA